VKNKITFSNFKGHLATISKHKFMVTKYCFKCGMIKQGLLHDLSKYSPVEFWSGVRYYQGFRSPIDAEKEDIGYSLGWLHHEGRNRHHWEYWIDKDYPNRKLIALKMPFNYLLESVVDRIVACKVYNKDNYQDDAAYNFFLKGRDRYFFNEETKRQLEYLLKYLADNGEEKALHYYKELYKSYKKDKTEI